MIKNIGREEMRVTLLEAIDLLNKGKIITEVANQAGVRANVLRNKLMNAAIKYDENERKWVYLGSDKEYSLSRKVKQRIVVYDVDEPYIESKVSNKNSDVTNVHDIEYELYSEYMKVDHSSLKEKKTFFLTVEMYQTIKSISRNRSLKINGLIQILLARGLEYYNLPNEKTSKLD